MNKKMKEVRRVRRNAIRVIVCACVCEVIPWGRQEACLEASTENDEKKGYVVHCNGAYSAADFGEVGMG